MDPDFEGPDYCSEEGGEERDGEDGGADDEEYDEDGEAYGYDEEYEGEYDQEYDEVDEEDEGPDMINGLTIPEMETVLQQASDGTISAEERVEAAMLMLGMAGGELLLLLPFHSPFLTPGTRPQASPGSFSINPRLCVSAQNAPDPASVSAVCIGSGMAIHDRVYETGHIRFLTSSPRFPCCTPPRSPRNLLNQASAGHPPADNKHDMDEDLHFRQSQCILGPAPPTTSTGGVTSELSDVHGPGTILSKSMTHAIVIWPRPRPALPS